jgi:hypothetical protein
MRALLAYKQNRLASHSHRGISPVSWIILESISAPGTNLPPALPAYSNWENLPAISAAGGHYRLPGPPNQSNGSKQRSGLGNRCRCSRGQDHCVGAPRCRFQRHDRPPWLDSQFKLRARSQIVTDLNQIEVRIAQVNRTQLTYSAGAFHRPQLNAEAGRFELRHHLIQRRFGDKA